MSKAAAERIYNEYYSAIKENEIIPFASAWRQGHKDYHSKWKATQTKTNIHDITYMWNFLKYLTDIYKTEARLP